MAEGRATWFHTGGPLVVRDHVWYDPEGRREGKQASGRPATEPGIATPGHTHLNHWFKLTLPDKRIAYWRKSDIGPGLLAQRRGVVVDINAAAASAAFPGGPRTFVERNWKVEHVGPELADGIVPGIQESA